MKWMKLSRMYSSHCEDIPIIPDCSNLHLAQMKKLQSTPNTSEKINVSVDENTAQEFRIACSPQPMSYSRIIQFVAPHAMHTDVTINAIDGLMMKSLLKNSY